SRTGEDVFRGWAAARRRRRGRTAAKSGRHRETARSCTSLRRRDQSAALSDAMMKSRTITCSIDQPLAAVYEFASNPENLPHWVRWFCLSVRKSGDEWQMETPTGWVGIQFVSDNEFGVLDHVVTLPGGQSILNTLRIVANG